MNAQTAIARLRDVLRRKHFSLKTERTYCGWLARYCEYLCRARLPAELASERKMEAYLTALAKGGCAASTQNQAFNALLFFYEQVADEAADVANFALFIADWWMSRAESGNAALCDPAHGDAGKPKTL